MQGIKWYASYGLTVVTMADETNDKICAESRRLSDILAELREVHGEPVAQTNEKIVFSDSHGHELKDIAHDIPGVSRGDVSAWMHKEAREVYDRAEATGSGDPWAVNDPVVVIRD